MACGARLARRRPHARATVEARRCDTRPGAASRRRNRADHRAVQPRRTGRTRWRIQTRIQELTPMKVDSTGDATEQGKTLQRSTHSRHGAQPAPGLRRSREREHCPHTRAGRTHLTSRRTHCTCRLDTPCPTTTSRPLRRRSAQRLASTCHCTSTSWSHQCRTSRRGRAGSPSRQRCWSRCLAGRLCSSTHSCLRGSTCPQRSFHCCHSKHTFFQPCPKHPGTTKQTGASVGGRGKVTHATLPAARRRQSGARAEQASGTQGAVCCGGTGPLTRGTQPRARRG